MSMASLLPVTESSGALLNLWRYAAMKLVAMSAKSGVFNEKTYGGTD